MVLAERFLSYEDTNFNAQTEFLRLDPRSDFRNADLYGADLSNSNLCGYDFTGSDLRGATGVNVLWDDSTILKDAETGSSVFAYSLNRDEYLEKNPTLAE